MRYGRREDGSFLRSVRVVISPVNLLFINASAETEGEPSATCNNPYGKCSSLHEPYNTDS
jgi:hypothetical protein